MGSDLAAVFGKAFRREPRTLRWRVDRREGDHWVELARFASKRQAEIGLVTAASRGEAPTNELRVRKV